MGPAAHLEDFEAIDVQDAHHLPLLAWLHLGDGGVLSHVPAPAGQGRGPGGGQCPALTWMLVLMRFTSQSKRRL